MPRPKQKMITFTIDGREVRAIENSMLVDAAKHGDVEIPVFCYEPKLGHPVGACRMCLVEIEGIPKLQTGCSTAVKDGMVVHTQNQRVQEAQRAVVEFLLINHPLDCPVCDKGGECPLQDITFGWGPGVSRYIEPKRHFDKPVELSPLIAIDRERCILCYRCVRYSQEVTEDYQLVLHQRGADSFVGTFDSHPYVAPFTGNITELCPVGALTSIPYRFRARPWDIEQGGTVCTLCPAQCNISLTVRDDEVMRVLGRDNTAVDDGWLCDKGRYAYQSVRVAERITQPLLRDGEQLRPTSWTRALAAAADGLKRAHGAVGAIAEGGTSNEEGYLLTRLMRETLASHSIDSSPGGALPLELRKVLADPTLQATVPDIEFAHTVLLLDCNPLDDAPILDLRIRKGVRLNKVQLAIATDRPTTLDENAKATVRYAPGYAGTFLQALLAALSDAGDVERLAQAAGAEPQSVKELAQLLTESGQDIVIVWGERMSHGAHGKQAVQALLRLAGQLQLAAASDAGLLELPTSANGRGLREVGVLPNAAAGLQASEHNGHAAPQIAAALATGELRALYLLDSDPLRYHPNRALWQRALAKVGTVITHASFLNDTVREFATVVFPAELYGEKEGTVTHPDGRLQRLRTAVAHPNEVRPELSILAELSKRLGNDLGVSNSKTASEQAFQAVPFYAGLTLEEIGGQGVRWQERPAAAAVPQPVAADRLPELGEPPVAPSPNGKLHLATYRPVWAAAAVEASPSLKFATCTQQVELAPADAKRLGIAAGDEVTVQRGSAAVTGTALPRTGVPTGSVIMQTGIATESANRLTDAETIQVEVVKQ